jgi:hypothetical protein
MRPRTASAACRSDRFSANCNTVTIASWPGEIPGRPRTPNASMNAPSVNTSPSSSRTRIASAPRGNAARATNTVCPGTSGSTRGRNDIQTSPHQRQQHTVSTVVSTTRNV